MKMKKLHWILLALPLAGCATAPPDRMPASSAYEVRGGTPLIQPKAPPAPAGLAEGDERAAPTLVKGSDIMIGTPSARGSVSSRGEAVSLRFEQAPVAEVVHAILGDLLKADYALVTPLAGEITLHTQAPVARDQVVSLLESVLQANGIAIVADGAGRYRVGKAEALKGTVPLPRRTGALAAGSGSVIVPLQYIGAAEMADILRPVASQEALLRVDTVRNLLMLAGTRNQIDGWLEIINTFDVDFLKGMSVGLFPLTHSSVKDVESALQSLLGSASVTTISTPGSSPNTSRQGAAAGGAGGRALSEQTDAGQPAGPLTGLIRVMPIERLNALLVVTPRAHYLEQAKVWIERLDRPTDSDVDGQLYVYPVQNGSAQHLASLLNGLYGGGQATTPATGTQANSGVASSLARNTQSTGSFGSFGSMGSGTTGAFGATGSAAYTAGGNNAAQGGTVTQVSIGQDIRVIADDHNNALLIHASRREYRRIESALRRLDVAPTQVLIEASIIEVTLTDALKYGLQWYFQDSLRGGYTGLGQLTNSESGTIEAPGLGFAYSIVNPAGSVRAMLNALATKSLLNVLSNPNVMVLDNHTATIQVGDQQPIQSSNSVTTDGDVLTSSIQYKDTGVLLTVTPSVNAGDMVTMAVNQAITDVGERDTATGQRSFNQRQITSRVAVRSGETIVLGGLIRDNKTRGKQGIPILHDIPVLGNLFGTTTVDTTRTELLVMITPRVIRSEQDVRDIGTEIRDRMRGLDALRGAAGGSLSRLQAVPQIPPASSLPAPVVEGAAPVVVP